MKRKLISFLIVVCIGTLFLKGATYYVSTTGNDSNGGTLSAPFATIQKAVDMSTSGSDVIYVRAGTYNQAVNISGKSGITLTRYGTETVYVQGNSAVSTAIIYIANSSNIIVSYLYVQNMKVNWAKGIEVIGAGTNIQIVGNKVNNIHYKTGNYNASDNPGSASVGANPIEIVGDNANSSLNTILISGNEVYNCMTGWCEGIAVKGNVENFNIELNTVHDITNIGIDAFGLGTYPVLSQNYQSRNGTIQRNTVYNCKCNYTDNGGIYVDGGKDISIVNNRVYNNIYGITLGCENQMNVANGTTSGIHVRNNFIYNNTRAGIMIGTSGDDDGLQGNVAYSDIMGNTLLKNATSDQWAGEIVLQNCNNITFNSNIIYGLYSQMFTYNLGTSGIVFKYNDYYYSNGSASSVVISQQTSSTNWGPISLSQFQALVGGDPGSIFANPSLVSDVPANGNFHINTSSPCVNAGDPSYSAFSGELDMDLATRIASGRIDMGCDETGGTSIAVTGVSVSPTTASISVGGTQQLTKTISPTNATNQNVTWSSSNASVATVNSSGLVTAVAAGSATITVTTVDGGKTANCAVTVTGSSSLPSPWATSDIGAVGATGSAGYSGSTFTVAGSGADVWDVADEFRYVYQQISGDVTITARVASLGNTNAWAKAGVMIRNGLGANVAHALSAVTPSSGLAFQRRVTSGGVSTHTAGPTGLAPYWVRLQRSGNTFTSSVSTNGTSWTTVGSETISMSTSVYVGLIVTSHSDGILCTATFDNVNVSTTANVPVTGVSVSPTSTSITVGGTQQLTATVAPSNATNKNVTWSSSNTSVATVNSTGLVTAVAAGSATITVTTVDGARTANCTVTVTSGGGGVNITIDGNLTDWSAVSAIATASGQSTTSLKVYDDDTYFYFGIAGSGLNTNYQLWLNTDNNTATGYNDWNYTSSGADYYVENGTLRKSTGTGWGWTDVATVTESRNTSAIEVRIPRSQLGTLSSTIKVAFSDVNSSWAVVSKLGYSSYTRLKSAEIDESEGSLSKDIFVFPNPATDELKINLGEGLSTINIYNQTGQLIYNKLTYNAMESIGIEELNACGFVLLQVIKDGQSTVVKVMLK